MMSTEWKTRLAIVGVVASAAVAVKALRNTLVWAELALGPVKVKQFATENALVTGGSEGIGKAVAKVLAGYGLNVVLVSRSQAKLDAAAEEIRQSAPQAQVRTITADLTQPDACQQLLQTLSDTNTPISVLIANVGGGICGPKPYWQYSDAEEAHVQQLNGQACYSLVKGLLPGMINRGKGAIVAVSSLMHKWSAFAAPYGAEKAKMNALMAALASELHGTGVTAQAMVLGPVDTPGIKNLRAAHQASRSTTSNTSSAGSGSAVLQAAAARGAAEGASEKQQLQQLQKDGRSKKAGSQGPSADAVAAAMGRAIGRDVGPVVTPYWGHVVLEWLVLDCWWPPSLQRAVSRAMSRKFKAHWDSLDEVGSPDAQ